MPEDGRLQVRIVDLTGRFMGGFVLEDDAALALSSAILQVITQDDDDDGGAAPAAVTLGVPALH
jgi:hypothetical protein